MVSTGTFRSIALSFPGAEEVPHFEKPSFRIRKKIFATLHEKDNRGMLKLSLINQSVFCSFANGTVFFPVPGAWGTKGYTLVDLGSVRKDMLTDALGLAYGEVSTKKNNTKATHEKNG